MYDEYNRCILNWMVNISINIIIIYYNKILQTQFDHLTALCRFPDKGPYPYSKVANLTKKFYIDRNMTGRYSYEMLIITGNQRNNR